MKKLSIAEEFKLKPIELRPRFGSTISRSKVKSAQEKRKLNKKSETKEKEE